MQPRILLFLRPYGSQEVCQREVTEFWRLCSRQGFLNPAHGTQRVPKRGQSPALTGRWRQWAQVKPPCPQGGALAPDDAEEPPPPEPVITFTALKLRSAFVELQAGHSGFAPSEYSDMDIRISKRDPQS